MSERRPWSGCLIVAALWGAPAAPLGALEPTPRIEDFAFLAGHWRGEGFGGTVEEIWSEPLGGAMVGSFRLVRDAEVQFYEIMVLGPDSAGFALKVKHFAQDFTAWEDKADAVRFGLQKVAGTRTEFDGLTIARDADKLTIAIRLSGKDSAERWEILKFRAYRPK